MFRRQYLDIGKGHNAVIGDSVRSRRARIPKPVVPNLSSARRNVPLRTATLHSLIMEQPFPADARGAIFDCAGQNVVLAPSLQTLGFALKLCELTRQDTSPHSSPILCCGRAGAANPALRSARVLDVLSSTPARPIGRAPCLYGACTPSRRQSVSYAG